VKASLVRGRGRRRLCARPLVTQRCRMWLLCRTKLVIQGSVCAGDNKTAVTIQTSTLPDDKSRFIACPPQPWSTTKTLRSVVHDRALPSVACRTLESSRHHSRSPGSFSPSMSWQFLIIPTTAIAICQQRPSDQMRTITHLPLVSSK
jgi:hypothetical protein